ncbi:MAG: uL15m family ribosomal protein, partial [Bacteroidota bacterium]
EQVKAIAVNVATLETTFEAGAEVTPKTLVAAGVIRNRRKQAPAVKILGAGELQKKLTVSGCAVSATAKEKIESAGGSVK